MEVTHNGQSIVNMNLKDSENLAKFYFENQKLFKGGETNWDNIAFIQREVFISILNHDLKIPTLAQIRALELLLDERAGQINNSQKEIISLTLSSCRYMYGMLSTLLSAYKYENKDIILYFENTDLTRLVEAYCVENENELKNKNVKFIIEVKNNILGISVDKLQIKKAFENIFDYVISCVSENSEIVCHLEQCENKIIISISFESPYISSKKLDNMFNMYASYSQNMDKVGSSLGLYLAKQIINAHDGKIRVHNAKKIVCTVELPCVN